MIAISHYGARGDISGVTSWLRLLLDELRSRRIPYTLNLHHFGDDPQQGSLYLDEAAAGMPPSTLSRSCDTAIDVNRTLEFLNEIRPKVFIPQCLPSVHFAAAIAAKHGLPWVFTIHSDDPAYWALADACGPHAKHGIWVAVSERIAREARAKYPHADVRIIPYGVPIPEALATWNPGRFRVVFSGRLIEEQKRVSKVIDVMIKACAASKRIEAVVIGDGPERAAMEARVAGAMLGTSIHFTGRLEKCEVAKELRKAHAILLMSDYEGLPVALLEAMATGVVPVVRSIRSGIPDIVKHDHTGYLVEDDVTAAAARITELSASPSDWERISTEARALVSSCYSHETCMDKWLAIIHELAGRSRPNHPIPIKASPRLPGMDSRIAHLDPRPTKSLQRFKSMPRRACGRLKRLCMKFLTNR